MYSILGGEKKEKKTLDECLGDSIFFSYMGLDKIMTCILHSNNRTSFRYKSMK
jgi:hypothetical protein